MGWGREGRGAGTLPRSNVRLLGVSGSVGGRGDGKHCGGRRRADSESKTRGLGALPCGVAPSP
eukprot:8473566-Prorocentrum_lima.AAC.1